MKKLGLRILGAVTLIISGGVLVWIFYNFRVGFTPSTRASSILPPFLQAILLLFIWGRVLWVSLIWIQGKTLKDSSKFWEPPSND